MDVTISLEEVTALIDPTLPSLASQPTFDNIRTLRQHLEHALQTLPCPQSIHLGWKVLELSKMGTYAMYLYLELHGYRALIT
jgi:hypothetical protein